MKIWSLPYLAYESPISENPHLPFSPPATHAPRITSALSPICTTSFRSNSIVIGLSTSHISHLHTALHLGPSQERESPDKWSPLSFVFLYLHYHFRIQSPLWYKACLLEASPSNNSHSISPFFTVLRYGC